MAQETLSLGQCLQMGIERNLNLKTYEGNVLKGKHNISENRARLLPQINIGAVLNDNFHASRIGNGRIGLRQAVQRDEDAAV